MLTLLEYELLAANPEFVDKIAKETYEAMVRARFPHFAGDWSKVSTTEKAIHGEIGLQVIHSLVADSPD